MVHTYMHTQCPRSIIMLMGRYIWEKGQLSSYIYEAEGLQGFPVYILLCKTWLWGISSRNQNSTYVMLKLHISCEFFIFMDNPGYSQSLTLNYGTVYIYLNICMHAYNRYTHFSKCCICFDFSMMVPPVCSDNNNSNNTAWGYDNNNRNNTAWSYNNYSNISWGYNCNGKILSRYVHRKMTPCPYIMLIVPLLYGYKPAITMQWNY